ncbi:MAG TPA: glycosyltransferase family 39 protein [Terriglobales bacterium]|nr:glycosyltransferase family 39 protein [Terriglobales bacterium]
MSEASPNLQHRSTNIRLAAIVIVAAILRLIFLGARSFWSDEIVSVKLATDNWGGFWFWITKREANMALYYLLLRGWVKAGDGETWVRLFSALAGIATVPLFYAVAKRLYDARVAWISGLLAATSACLVQFSQEARSYSLVILLCVASYYFFTRLLQEERLWLVAAYVLVSAAAMYAHFFAALVMTAQAVSVLWLPARMIRLGRLALAWAAFAMAALPISFYVLKRDVGQLYWVQPTTIAEVYKLTVFFAGGSKAVAAVLSVLSVIAIVVAIAKHRKQLKSKSEASWRFAVVLLWAVLPVLLTVVVSLHKPLFVHRYLLVALPGYLLLIALGLAHVRSLKRLWGCLAVFMGLSAVSIAQGYHRPVEDWRGAVDHVLSNTQPQDFILIYIPYGANDFFFYVERRERRGQRIRSVRIDSANSVAQLEAIDSPRSWLLLYPSPHVAEDAPLFEKTLTNKYSNLERKQFKGIEVLLFSQPLKRPPSRPQAESTPHR